MSLSLNDYAKILYNFIKNIDEKNIDSVLLAFLHILKKDNKLKKIDKIIKIFIDIYDKENKILNLSVFSRTKINEENIDIIKSIFLNKYKGYTVFVRNYIDKKILGGVLIKYKNTIIDATINNILYNNLHNKLLA